MTKRTTFTDHSGMADHSPDYDLPERLELTEPAQYRALFEETRARIVQLLLERAATTTELADAIGRPKGTIGHHLKALESAGLVHVVRTRRVRALEARYYGRTARVFLYREVGEAVGEPQRVLARAADEIRGAAGVVDVPVTANQRYARIPVARAEEWKRRLDELTVELTREPAAGDTTFSLVVALYPVETGRLPDAPGTDPATADPAAARPAAARPAADGAEA